MNFYVLGQDAESVKAFFSVLPEEERPRIVSDKENPAVWDHQSDKPVVIVTDEPRVDAEATEITLDKQVDEVMEQIAPTGEISTDDPTVTPPAAPEEEEPVKGPRTYADRGFKVGRIS